MGIPVLGNMVFILKEALGAPYIISNEKIEKSLLNNIFVRFEILSFLIYFSYCHSSNQAPVPLMV